MFISWQSVRSIVTISYMSTADGVSRTIVVLHPYYKFYYFDLKWGGEKEQQEEIENGNPSAKNWKDEARKVVRTAVCLS